MLILYLLNFLIAKSGGIYIALKDDQQKVLARRGGLVQIRDKGTVPNEEQYTIRLLNENGSYVFKFGTDQLCYRTRIKRVRACKSQKTKATWQLVRDGLAYLMRQNGQCISLVNTIKKQKDKSALTLKDCNGPDAIKVRFYNSNGEILDVDTDYTVENSKENIELHTAVETVPSILSDPHTDIVESKDITIRKRPRRTITEELESVSEPSKKVRIVEAASEGKHVVPLTVTNSEPAFKDQKAVRVKEVYSPNREILTESGKSVVVKHDTSDSADLRVIRGSPSKEVVVETRPLVTTKSGLTTKKIVSVPEKLTERQVIVEEQKPIKVVKTETTEDESEKPETPFQQEDVMFMKGTREFQNSLDQNLDTLVHSKEKKKVRTITTHSGSNSCKLNDITGAIHCH